MANNPLADLLAQMGGGGCDADCNHGNHPPMSDAECVRALHIAFSMLATPVAIKPGDIIRGRKELVESHIKSWDQTHILIRFLSEPVVLVVTPDSSGSCVATKIYDCEIGHVHAEGFVRHLADSREWEPHPAAAMLKIGQTDA